MNLAGLLDILYEIPAYAALREALDAGRSAGDLNLMRAARPFILAALSRDLNRPILVVTARVDRAYNIAEQLPAWVPDVPVLRFTSSAAEQLGRDAGGVLGDAGRLLVITHEPGLDAAALAGDEVLGTVPAVRDGRLVITADVSYGSVYTALEILIEMDRLLRL